MVTRAVGSFSRWRSRTLAEVSPVRRSRRPWDPELGERRSQRGLGVGGEGAQRRQPEDAQGRRRGPPPRAEVGLVSLHPFEEGADPGGVGLAGAGAGVDQPALAGAVGVPDLALKGERGSTPAARTSLEAGEGGEGHPGARGG